MRETDLAWAAGFIDGEGTFRYKTNQYNFVSLELTVGQIHQETLIRLRDILECGRVYGPYIKKKGLPIYTYGLSKSGKVIEVYNLLSPYLSTPKLLQGLNCINIYNNRNSDGPGRKVGYKIIVCKFGHEIKQHGTRRFCRPCANRRNKEYYVRIKNA